ALSITSPEKHDDVDLSKSTTIEWNSVSSDPSSFDIYLVNMNGYPNVNKLVAENVKTSDNSYTLKDLAGIDNGSGFQINFMSNDDKNTGILAQSAQFNVESSDSASTSASLTSTSTSSSSSASSASSSTTEGTSTVANSSSSATPSETVVPANGAGSLKVPVAAAGSLLMGLYMML
ncbi:GPI anchored serine-threonine rich family protein, partial [Aspergillus ruber CBS 135680]